MNLPISLNCASSRFTSAPAGPTPSGDPRPPRSVEEPGVAPLRRRHREHDRLHVLEPLRVRRLRRLHRLHRLAVHPRQHPEQRLHRAHLVHLAQRLEEVLEVEPLLRDRLLRELLGLLPVERLLRLLDQRQHVAHLQHPARDAVRPERLERVQRLARADVLDRRLRRGVDRERRAAAGVAVHLRQHHAGDAEGVVEPLRDADGVLPRHPVGHEEGLVGRHRGLERPQLAHHLLVDLRPAGGVHQHRPRPGVQRRLDAPPHDAHHVLRTRLRVDADARLGREQDQLVHRRRAVHVRRHQERGLLLPLEALRQLRRRRGLPGALQADEEDDRGRHAREADRHRLLAEQRGQLLVHILDELLARRHRLEGRQADGLGLHPLDEGPRDLEADVRLQQHSADGPQTILDGLVGQYTAPPKLAKRGGKLLAKLVEHEPLRIAGGGQADKLRG